MRDLKQDILHVAIYDHGGEETFGISPVDCHDSTPLTVARRLQAAGWLPSGNIVSVEKKVSSGR